MKTSATILTGSPFVVLSSTEMIFNSKPVELSRIVLAMKKPLKPATIKKARKSEVNRGFLKGFFTSLV